MNEENVHTMKKGKLFECKNSGKKKGLSLRNVENHAICTKIAQSSFISTGKFQIYSDGNNENDRSRSRVRKDVCKKKIKTREIEKQDNEALEKTIVSTIKVAESNSSNNLHISRRSRSSSNYQQNAFLDKTKMNSKLFNSRRAYSESRKISLQYAQSNIAQLPDIQKIKHLTDEVKKRTFSSIQMWKDKMRKSYTGTVPKNINLNNRAQVGINKLYPKTNLRKNSLTGSTNLQPKMLQNCMTYPNENIKHSTQKVDILKDALVQYSSNEIDIILQDKSLLTVQNNMNKRSFISDNAKNNNPNTTLVSFNSLTPLGPSFLPLTPTKMRYEKRVMIKKSLIKKDNEFDIIENLYEREYLEDIPETERKRDDNAPRLSSRFLHENVNAKQRRIVVGFIIRLSIYYYYSSHIIYQTVKLFNVAIDRIYVEINDIQLMALACLWIILKQDARSDKIPSATVILQLGKDLYINQEKYLLKYEKKILCAVKFNIRFADPFSLLLYYILNINQNSQCNIIKSNDFMCVYFCGSYMIDLSMLDENLCDIPAYVIAIAAVELSLRFVYLIDDNIDQAWCQVWRSKQSLTEWEERMINSTKQIIIRHALDYNNFSSNVIYKKYMRSKHGKVTYFLHDKLKTVVS